jgi:hypothetical protein
VGAPEFSNVARVSGPISLGNQRLDPLSDDLRRRPAENRLSAFIEEGDALKCIHADDRIRRDLHNLCQNVVRYPVGHLCPVIPYKKASFPSE